MHTVLYILVAIVSYFVWTTIHELSHYLMAKKLVGVTNPTFRLWPHFYQGQLRFGGIYCTYIKTPSTSDIVLIHLAPRIPGAIAVIAFVFLPLLTGTTFVLLSIICSAGLIDFAYGSIGWNENSDLRIVATTSGTPIWFLRIVSWLAVLISLFGWLLLTCFSQY